MYRTMFFLFFSHCRNSPTLHCSFSSTYGPSSSVSSPLLLASSAQNANAHTLSDDGEYVANSGIINGAACHTMHHLYFNYNYGQFTTLWDRLGGSYRQPNDELFHRQSKMSKAEWERQCREMETVQKEVEGEDDRSYEDEPTLQTKKVV